MRELPRGTAADVMNHGDLIAGNVLVSHGRLAGVIDVGGAGPADPALDRGLQDKGTKGKRARSVPMIEQLRPLVESRIAATGKKPDARLFAGPRGGRIQVTVLRRATHWDEVVATLGYEHLRMHSLRHTGLTWFADARSWVPRCLCLRRSSGGLGFRWCRGR